MLKQIALATLTAAALVAPPSLVHAFSSANGHNLNGVNVNGHNLNGVNVNGIKPNGVNVKGIKPNGVEPAGREVYFVGEQAGGERSTALTIELPRVTR